MQQASQIIKPLPKGQITIPAKIRRELGIDEKTIFEAQVERGKLILIPLKVEKTFQGRIYSDRQIKEFLKEDQIDKKTYHKVMALLGKS